MNTTVIMNTTDIYVHIYMHRCKHTCILHARILRSMDTKTDLDRDFDMDTGYIICEKIGHE